MNLKNNGVRYEDALHDCGIPTKTWEQAGQLSLDLKNAAQNEIEPGWIIPGLFWFFQTFKKCVEGTVIYFF